MALLAELARRWPDLPVIMLTAHGNVPLAVEAMKAGAAEFMLKPFDREELVFVVQKVLRGAERASRAAPVLPTSSRLLGESAAMRGVMDLVRRAAPGNATVLLLRRERHGQRARRARHPRGEPAQREAHS